LCTNVTPRCLPLAHHLYWQEEFEDTKGVNIIRMYERTDNKMTTRKGTNNDPQNTTQKTKKKIEQHERI
jgi:hypothetical protein